MLFFIASNPIKALKVENKFLRVWSEEQLVLIWNVSFSLITLKMEEETVNGIQWSPPVASPRKSQRVKFREGEATT